MKLLIFSDIHGDLQALEKLLATEADYYIAAGDLSTWGRGLDRCGEILKSRGDRVYVLPGNHESAGQIAALCREYGLNDFHERTLRLGEWTVAGLGYSNPTPFNTPGEYSERELAERLEPFARPRPAGAHLPLPALRHLARPRCARAGTAAPPRSATSSPRTSPRTSSAATSTKPPAPWNRSEKHSPRMPENRATC